MAINRENVIRSAEKYVSKGKLEAAIREYRKVLAENPNDANTLNRVGDLYARIERIDEAVKLFSQIAEQYTRDGFFVKAIAIYKKIIKLDPSSLMVYERLAELYHKQGLLNEARTQYQVLADYYQKHDNAASAIAIFQRMAEMEPDNPAYVLKLAELYTSQKLTEKAIRSYRSLADLLIVAGSVDEAVQVYQKALEVSSRDLEFIRDAVMGLQEGGHTTAALQVMARAVELNPEAQGLGRQIGLDRGPEEDLDQTFLPEPEPEPPSSFDVAGSEPEADVYELPATDSFVDFASPDLSFAAEGASEAFTPEEDDSVFTLDLDDDDVPDTLVEPPEDMAELTSQGDDEFELVVEGFDDDGDIPDTLVEPPEELAEPTRQEDDEFELVVEGFDDDDVPDTLVEPPADMLEPAAGVEPPEVEIDWSLDAMELAAPEPIVELESDEAPADVEVDLELDASEEEITLFEEPVVEIDDADDIADTDELEPAAAAVGEPPAPERTWDSPADSGLQAERREEDLLAEAKVFAKYGLQEKARDRLTELLELHPQSLAGLQLLTRLDLKTSEPQAVLERANQVAELARQSDELELWHELQTDLEREGYLIADDQVAGVPGAKPPQEDRIAQLLEDLSLEGFAEGAAGGDMTIAVMPGAAEDLGIHTTGPVLAGTVGDEGISDDMPSSASEPAIVEPDPAMHPSEDLAGTADDAAVVPTFVDELLPDIDAPSQNQAGEQEQPREASPTRMGEVPSPTTPLDDEAADGQAPELAAASSDGLFSLADELRLDELDDDDEEDGTASTVASSDSAAAFSDPLDETGMSWLDDVPEKEGTASPKEETIFEEEDDFFDLAAELERELIHDEQTGDTASSAHDQSLEEIIEGFKQGVAENLSPKDYDTHFNLGIAYREMGLLDEAIGEFQLASKDTRHLVEASSMLGMCFLEKGLPELSVRWYRKGLESPMISETESLGLLYEMGNAYLALGDHKSAHKTFVEIYGLNTNYRDISAKLKLLDGQTG